MLLPAIDVNRALAIVFFILSKTLDKVASPLAWVVALIVASAVLTTTRPRAARWAAIAAAALLTMASLPVVSDGLLLLLESSARTTMRPEVVYDVVVVLGGMTELAPDHPDDSITATSFSDAVDRALTGFALLREGRASNILLTGGDVTIAAGAHPYGESDAVARELRRWGVREDAIVVERMSRNTHENAVESARIIREHGWRSVLLVTSAFHMKRAAGCFSREGVSFDTLPTDFRQSFSSPFVNMYFPGARSLMTTESMLRELLGRAAYRVRGYSTDWR